MSLLTEIVCAGTRRISTLPCLNPAKSIISKGNGQPRVIVNGFSGKENLSIWSEPQLSSGRAVIRGFADEQKELIKVAESSCWQIIRAFLPYKNNRMKSHFVRDIQPPRVEVKGFTASSDPQQKIKGTPIAKPLEPLKKEDIFAQERRVVQGFGGNPTNLINKKMDLYNTSERIVVKGFA